MTVLPTVPEDSERGHRNRLREWLVGCCGGPGCGTVAWPYQWQSANGNRFRTRAQPTDFVAGVRDRQSGYKAVSGVWG